MSKEDVEVTCMSCFLSYNYTRKEEETITRCPRCGTLVQLPE